MKFFTSILMLCMVAGAVPAAADLKAGIAAYKAGDYTAARKEFSAAAEAKEPLGIHLMASLYFKGQGVKKDVSRAVELYREAAGMGFRASQTNLGLMYHTGNGVERNIEKALSYYIAAGKQGDLQATFNLGQIFRKGDGVKQDLERALTYYRLAVQLGYVPAVNEYGLLYARGDGVARNDVEAYGWIAFAANSGNKPAKENLSKLEALLGDDLEKAKARATVIAAEIAKQQVLVGADAEK